MNPQGVKEALGSSSKSRLRVHGVVPNLSAAVTMPKRIAHNAHREHPLVLRDTGGSGFRCDGCGCDGFGLRYRCGECDFDLHEHCAT
jgi:hypothetical protein